MLGKQDVHLAFPYSPCPDTRPHPPHDNRDRPGSRTAILKCPGVIDAAPTVLAVGWFCQSCEIFTDDEEAGSAGDSCLNCGAESLAHVQIVELKG